MSYGLAYTLPFRSIDGRDYRVEIERDGYTGELSDPDDFSKYVGEVFDLALYDTDANVRYGDKLITLITCSYENRIENERFVIVARKLT